MQRRTFLQFLFGGSFLAYLDAKYQAIAGMLPPALDQGQVALDGQRLSTLPKDLASHITHIIRPDDLLNLRFEFVNLSVQPGAEARLVRIDQGAAAYIRVVFPPQHIAEQAFDRNQPILPEPPIRSRAAGESRLVFVLPPGVNEIPYRVPSLLSWEQWHPSVVPVALPPEYAKTARSAQVALQAVSQGALHSQLGGYSLRLPQIIPPGGKEPSPAQVLSAAQLNAQAFTAQAFDRTRSVFAGQKPVIAEPGANQTAIEAPSRLILSPHQGSAWAHASSPVSRKSSETGATAGATITRTELWHTRLGVREAPGQGGAAGVDEHNDFLRTVRAVWSPDYLKTAAGSCGEGNRKESLTAGERNQIVHLSADYSLPFVKPVRANHLMLSAFGAWLDLRGDWEPETPYGLESWSHRATMGRDQFVRVVCKGYLFPFGHRASLITITERTVEDQPVHGAYLRFRQFVVVREPEMQYAKEPAGTGREAVEGRSIPFQTVRLKTLVTPPLNPLPDQADGWLQVDQRDFLFQIEAEDWDGRRCEFTAPLNFMRNTLAEYSGGFGGLVQKGAVKARAELYNAKPEFRSRRERPLAGQKVAYAPSTEPGDTSFETDLLVLGGGFRKEAKEGELLFYPLMQSATVRLAAASRLTGSNTGVAFSLFAPFLTNGFGAGNSEGEVFAKIPEAPALNFPAARAGGVATPNLAVRGLSRRFGIVGGSPDNTAGTWEQDLLALAQGNLALATIKKSGQPDATFFSRFFTDAKLLGAVALADIVSPDFAGGSNVPRFQSVPVYGDDGSLRAIKTRFEWHPAVRDSGVFIASKGNAGASFRITTETVMPLDGSPATSVTSGELNNFTLDLLGGVDEKLRFLKLKFGSLGFTARDRQKPDFSASGLDIEFWGALQFLRSLESVAGGDGFSDPPSLDITAEGVRLGYTLRLPSVTTGAFSLENIAFSAGLLLPFTGAPLDLRLAFCERDNPFTLTYLVFAGGGYFGIELGTDGLHAVEAALEFGANLSLNLGVASGKAYFMVGIYFRVTQQNGSSVPHLEGYVRSGAALEVLGLIAVSVQFRFALDYEPASGSATGSGTVTVEVDVAFFSKSVDITLSKSFAGDKPRTTTELLEPGPATELFAWLEGEDRGDAGRCWQEYCSAFAGDGA